MTRAKVKLFAALGLAAVLGSAAVARAPSGDYCGCAARCATNACESDCARRFAPALCPDATGAPPGGRLCGDDERAAAGRQASSEASAARSPGA